MKFLIVDLDGSLCNDTHRKHLAESKKWDEYHSLSSRDEPNDFVLTLIRKLINDNVVAVVITGRTNDYESSTNEWLHRLGVYAEFTYMRKFGDHRPATVLKRESLNAFLSETSSTVDECVVAIEDTPVIVDLWRSLNIPVLQVHQRQ